MAWSAELDNAAFATVASIKGWPAGFKKWNAVVDWHSSRDVGVIWGGVAYTGMGVSNDLYLIQPNPNPGAERYVFVDVGNFDSVLAPPGYTTDYIYNTTFNGRHNGRIIGDYLYTLSVENTTSLTNKGSGKYSIKVDLLRLALTGPVGPSALTRMAPLVYQIDTAPGAPAPSADEGMDFPCVTFDRKLNVLLVYLTLPPPHNLFAYLPDHDEWVEVAATPPAGRRRLAGCDYSPDHELHAYLDGETDRTAFGWGTIALQRLE